MGRVPGRKSIAGAEIIPNNREMKAVEKNSNPKSMPSGVADTKIPVTMTMLPVTTAVGALGGRQFRGYLKR